MPELVREHCQELVIVLDEVDHLVCHDDRAARQRKRVRTAHAAKLELDTVELRLTFYECGEPLFDLVTSGGWQPRWLRERCID